MIVNGKELNLDAKTGVSLAGLLDYLKINPSSVAIERNGSIEEREKWELQEIDETDRIEIIKFIGGG